LHDIGKIAKLHSDKGRHTREHSRGDRAGMRHSDSGHAILSHVAGFEAIAHAVRHQYEHVDGSGYPDHMKDDEIPIASRIIAITNAYDEAVFSVADPSHTNREAGRKVLLDGKGERFDPALVELFLEYIDKEVEPTCSESEVELPPGHLKVGMVLSRPLRNSDGVLLLKEGAELTAEVIERIQMASSIDPVLNGVFVKCAPETPPEPDDEDPEAASKEEPRQCAPAPTVEKRGKKALIVDDDMAVASALRRELRRAGWDTVCADNGRAAQSLLEDETFDLLLIDVAMPVMSGDLLIAHLEQRWPDLPCVVITGHATREQLVRISRASNLVRILAKPWDSKLLIQTVNSALQGRRRGKAARTVSP
ncbi:MAG: response regulator, partial [Phycisphaerae bacterium]